MTTRQKIFYRLVMQRFAHDTIGRSIQVTGEGAENVPGRGAALVTPNHRCWMDPIFIAQVIKRPVQWAGIDFHFKIPVVRNIASNAGIIPISVEGGKKSRASLKIAVDILRKGRRDLVGIFPEGAANFLNPSMDEKIIRFHTGFARIALEAKVPVIPVAVVGKNEKKLVQVPGALMSVFTPLEAFSHGATLLIYEAVHIVIGKPIDLSPYYLRIVTKELLHKISSRVRSEVIRLYEKGQKHFSFFQFSKEDAEGL